MSRVSVDSLSLQDTADASALILQGNGSASHSYGINVEGPEDGSPYRSAMQQNSRDERIMFESYALDAVLSSISALVGKCYVTNGTTKLGVRAFGQVHNRCGTSGRNSAGNHYAITASKAHVLVRRITLPANKYAMVSLECICLSLSGGVPTSTIINATLPTSGVTVNELFRLYPLMQVAGVTLSPEFVQSVTIDTGITAEAIMGTYQYVQDVDIQNARPKIEIAVDDQLLNQASKFTGAGKICTHANTEFFAGKLTSGGAGGFDDFDASTHIKFSAAGYARLEQGLQASGNGISSTRIVIDATGTLASVPLQITPDSDAQLTL
jgi:hypothetical protein